MAEIVVFHHILGLTTGVESLANELRAAGHTVHTPDAYAGRRFDSIEAGAAFAHGPDAPDLDGLADAAVAELPAELVYLGISLGVMQAQRLAQTRPGAAGAILLEAALPITGEWAIGPWPEGVPVQIHGMDADPFFAGEGDIDAAREIVATVPGRRAVCLSRRSAPVRGPVTAVIRRGRHRAAHRSGAGVPGVLTRGVGAIPLTSRHLCRFLLLGSSTPPHLSKGAAQR